MEDLQTQYQGSPSPETSSPMPDGSAKPAKKRKSWGQVLPEPKTQLPPRKRAKTEDEKEQRRIERVKRNRLAAHNSRERKRAEVEQLQGEKDLMQSRMDKMEEELARATRENKLKDALLNGYRTAAPELKTRVESGIQIPESTDSSIESLFSNTVCPRQTSFPSPESMDSMDTPHDTYSQPATPSYSEITVFESDTTRYPAEILCDLQ
ncbi:hypothetical protein BU16DRAFT_453277, partial [Lophium mytilinum]